MLPKIYTRIIFALALAIVLLPGFGATTLAGGWAAVTLDSLPVEPRAGEVLHVGFMVRQHGLTPINYAWESEPVKPYLLAHNPETGQSIRVEARQEGPVGHFVVDVEFPSAGTWAWRIEPAPFGAFPEQFEPLAVLPARPGSVAPISENQVNIPVSFWWPALFGLILAGGVAVAVQRGILSRRAGIAMASVGMVALLLVLFVWPAVLAGATTFNQESVDQVMVAPPPRASYGRALFVAKGCAACHMHHEISRSVPGPLWGPDLSTYPLDPDFVRRWLRDPAAVRPGTEMPNLGLSEAEIEALIMFLTENKVSANLAPDPFFVRAKGAKGPLTVYNMASQQPQFTLPAGMPSADWQHYYAAIPGPDKTVLNVFDPHSGNLEARFVVNGRWQLSGVAPLGRWLALTKIIQEREKAAWAQENRWETTIQIVDAIKGQMIHDFSLEGNFEVETISADGNSLFLIQHLPAINPTHYLVRLYDLSAQALQPDSLRDKRFVDEVMTGLAWGGLASADGEWLLTLYLNTQRNVAFIHALNLKDKFPVCIFLPSGDGDFSRLKHYSLAFAPDEQKVYAANAALGIVAEVSLNSFSVIRQVEFAASFPAKNYEPATPTNYSVISKDGRKLYFTSGWDVWAYDTQANRVSGPYVSQAEIESLGLSQDDRHLFVAVRGESPLALKVGDTINN